MEEFLLASKRSLSTEPHETVRIVLGNSTCDLDSAICALIQGFCEYLDAKQSALDILIIPILNVPEKEFRVKTEVIYYLEHHKIPLELLTFRDQIDLKLLKEKLQTKLEVVLVDHHSLPNEDVFLSECVIKVIDHRPQDPAWPWTGKKVILETVGSCATLVGRNFLESHSKSLSPQIASLLRGPIIIDTCNFSKEADRAKALDYEIIDALEKVGGLDSNRRKVFDEIVDAKSDISRLTVDDLMIRDLKVASGVPIVGLPLLVENFLLLEDAHTALKRFAESRYVTILIIIGLQLDEDKVSRDIAVFSLPSDRLKDKIIQALTTTTEPALELTLRKHIPANDTGFELILYRQGNLKASRKQILPIVRDVAAV